MALGASVGPYVWAVAGSVTVQAQKTVTAAVLVSALLGCSGPWAPTRLASAVQVPSSVVSLLPELMCRFLSGSQRFYLSVFKGDFAYAENKSLEGSVYLLAARLGLALQALPFCPEPACHLHGPLPGPAPHPFCWASSRPVFSRTVFLALSQLEANWLPHLRGS